MKDNRITVFKVLFIVILFAAIAAYVYFLYPVFKTNFEAYYFEYQVLEKEKSSIAEVMVNPEAVKEEIAGLKTELEEWDDIGYLTQATLADDIAQNAEELGVKIENISIGKPEIVGKARPDGEQLLSVPAEIICTTPYDGGMYFIGFFEKSTKGAYRIDKFSFESVEEGDASDDLEWNIQLRLLYYGDGDGTAPDLEE